MKPNANNIRANMIMSEISGLYHDICVKLQMPDSEIIILYTIRFACEGCTQSEISRLSGISRKTINSAVQKMINAGYLSTKRTDGKNVGLFLTEAGEELAGRTADVIIKMENDIHNSWTEEENALYLKLNERFRDSLKEQIAKI